MQPTVLIATTSRWYPAARLAIALAQAGCNVETVCPSGHPVAKTRAVRRTFQYHGLAPLRSFINAIATSDPDLVVSGDDLATRHLHSIYRLASKRAESELCALIERSLGAAESFPIEYARTTFIEEAQIEGIRVPQTMVVGGLNELKEWIEQKGFPVVLKANGTSGGYGVRIVRNMEEAKLAFNKLHASPSLLRAAKRAVMDHDMTLISGALSRRHSVVNAQTYVAGVEATTAVACWQGNVLAALHFEVLKKRNAEGPATVVRIIQNAEMSATAEKMVRRLKLSGLHGFDFMLESQTGNAYLIEMNPRATQVGHLNLGPGRDIPSAVFSILAGDNSQPASAVTNNETIALFPQEWIRDASSDFLRTAYHDVPWSEPGLILDCVKSYRKQNAWYSQTAPAPSNSALVSTTVPSHSPSGSVAGLD